jgi:hypothetical protein
LLPLLISACGGGGGATTVSGDPLAAATAAMAKQGSEKVAIQGTGDFQGQKLTLDGNGAFKGDDGELHLVVGVGGLGSTNVDEIRQNGTIYLQSPLLATTLAGKHWLKLTAGKRANFLGFDLSPLTDQTPSSVLAKLSGDGSVSTVGKDTIGGVETTHYRKTLDVTEQGADYKSVDAWVDDQGLVRKLQLDYDAHIDPTSKTPAHTVLTMTLSDFGAPVTVTPPAPSDTLDASKAKG